MPDYLDSCKLSPPVASPSTSTKRSLQRAGEVASRHTSSACLRVNGISSCSLHTVFQLTTHLHFGAELLPAQALTERRLRLSGIHLSVALECGRGVLILCPNRPVLLQ